MFERDQIKDRVANRIERSMDLRIIRLRCAFLRRSNIRMAPFCHASEEVYESSVGHADASGQEAGEVAGGGAARGQRGGAQPVHAAGHHCPQVVEHSIRALLAY